jgi:signal recognition particle subunit SRP54
MFESIQSGLSVALKKLTGSGKLTESNVRDGLRDVQRALLEADVNYEVVREFIGRVTEEAVGEQVLRSLHPSQQIVGIVHRELAGLMGPVDHSLHLVRDGVTVLMLCGLQGSGKTTTAGKLAALLRERGRKPMLVAADLQRPAAVEQLKVLGEQLGVPVYTEALDSDPVSVCRNALKLAKKSGEADVLILDTAGRLHIDDELMRQLEEIDRRVEPQQIYFVCDAMTGQDAVNSAKSFNEALELDGVILTKLDGDARGGAALSVKAVTGVPIKFIGVGEKLDKLEEFHPDRMAGRILGMGDVVSLFEKAHQTFDQEEMQKQEEKLRKGQFTLDDFKKQIGQMKKMGPMREILSMIPGVGQAMQAFGDNGGGDLDADGDVRRLEGIINSMTPDERANPDRIDQSRRRRIAAGSGVEPSEVNQLLKQFDAMQGLMTKMAGMGLRERMRAMQQLGHSGLMNPGAQLKRQKQRSKRLTPRERAKLKKLRAREKKKGRKK